MMIKIILRFNWNIIEIGLCNEVVFKIIPALHGSLDPNVQVGQTATHVVVVLKRHTSAPPVS